MILIAQFTMGIATLIYCRNTFCKDDSNLGMARLLRDMVNEMEEEGTAASGDHLCKFLDRAGGTKRRYGAVVADEKGVGEKLALLKDGGLLKRVGKMIPGTTYM